MQQSVAGDVTIRGATLGDASLLASVAERLFRDTFARDNTGADMDAYVAATFSVARQSAELADPRVTVLLVEWGAMTIGYAQLLEARASGGAVPMPTIELQRFYVDPAFHGAGVARALMDEVISIAASRGFASVWLGVWERNARAIAFYRKCGFTDIGSQPFVLGSDVQTDRLMYRSVAS